MNFPHPNNINSFHSDTLIDGEVNIIESVSGPVVVFTAFDLVIIDGVSIAQRSLSTRLGILQQDIIKPLHQSIVSHPHWHQPFKIEMTRHERSYGLGIIMQQYPKLTGLIFTPVRTPYTPQRNSTPTKLYLILTRFQWNIPEMNCCSFKIQVIWDKERKAHYQLLIADRLLHKYFDDFTPEPELLKDWKQSPPDGKIIDCRFDKGWETLLWENGYAGTVRTGGWRFSRFRDDKTMADDEKKLKGCWKSFINPVPLEAVLSNNIV
jgi:hypothetical protein